LVGCVERRTAEAAGLCDEPRTEGMLNTSHTSVGCGFGSRGNDPSAGSPTETLLRLILPLSDKVHETSRTSSLLTERSPSHSPDHSIGRSDGRCVQRAGT
jgi:hypothetical protein